MIESHNTEATLKMQKKNMFPKIKVNSKIDESLSCWIYVNQCTYTVHRKGSNSLNSQVYIFTV